jgi:hypothetical protein
MTFECHGDRCDMMMRGAGAEYRKHRRAVNSFAVFQVGRMTELPHSRSVKL